MALHKYGSNSKTPLRTGTTEFDILKTAHRFLRDEEDPKDLSWEDQLAMKYYASLYREFAVCDLKHYKSGNFALRWRTEDEVLSGAGETTCGNTRCDHHQSPSHLSPRSLSTPPLTTLELPFSYTERGENMSALVKVVLCPKCVNKLMWKRRKEKGKDVEQEEQEEERRGAGNLKVEGNKEVAKLKIAGAEEELAQEDGQRRGGSKHRERYRDKDNTRRRSSRSRSPQLNLRRRSSPTRNTDKPERARRTARSP